METQTDPVQTPAVLVSRRGAHGTAYHEEYCWQILEFFKSAPQTMNANVSVLKHANYVNHHSYGTRFTTGSKREEVRRICAIMPTFERFATSIGVTTATLRNWRAKYPEFEEACRMCEQIQRDFLQQGLLNGSISPIGGIFVAKNVTAHHDTPMVDKVEHGVTNVPEGVQGERPALAERTPEELARLRQLVEEARALGVRVTT
jgi:hypothetical protein